MLGNAFSLLECQQVLAMCNSEFDFIHVCGLFMQCSMGFLHFYNVFPHINADSLTKQYISFLILDIIIIICTLENPRNRHVAMTCIVVSIPQTALRLDISF